MADKKINGSLEITGKLNPNASGYGFNLPSSAPLTANEKIATEDYVDDALSGIKIGLNGKTYTATGTTIELPDLAEVKGVPGNYPEYIDATVANGMAGKISWEDIQLAIDDGSIDFAAHTFDAYINFYFTEVLAKYGLYSSMTTGEPPVPGYIAILNDNSPVTMPDTVVDFATLKAWIIANIGTLVAGSSVDEALFDSDMANYNVENGIPDLNIEVKNDDILCEAHLKNGFGVGTPIVGATNPPTVPGLEYTVEGDLRGIFTGDVRGGKVSCSSLFANDVRARSIGSESDTVGTVFTFYIGNTKRRAERIYVWSIGDETNKVRNLYADNIGSPTSKVGNIFVKNIGTGLYKTDYVFANNIGGSKNLVGNVFAYNIGHPSVKVENIYANNIGSTDSPVANFYATNVILANLPTSDPGIAGALWNDGGILKISAGQQPTA